MKTYKVKSLLYLSCFIIAAVLYYYLDQDENFQKPVLDTETADLKSERLPSHGELEDTLE